MSAASVAEGKRDPRVAIDRGLTIFLALLVVQNALGIYVNLFVSLSLPPNLGAVFPVILSNGVLIAHGLVAMTLLGFSIRYALLPTRRVGGRFRNVALLLVAVLAATSYMGYHFVGTQENVYSFGMEMGFLAALLLDLYLIRLLARRGTEPGRFDPASSAPSTPSA